MHLVSGCRPGTIARINPPVPELPGCACVGDIGEVACIEPLRNVKFGNELVQKEVDGAITKIHQRNFTRECPFCAEIIKKRANVCKHCGKEVAGN